ncbi:hypothetical protein [Gemmatimonas sp.]
MGGVDPVRRAETQKAAGQRSERLFDRTHALYLSAARAVIVHLHPPVFGAPGAMKYAGGGHVDYTGTLWGSGRAIAFDVKGVTRHPKLTVPIERPITHKDHKRSVRDRKRMLDQAALLLNIQRAGGLAAFLCVDMARERCWIMTDVATIARGEDVAFRKGDTDLFPAVAFTSVPELARGGPPIDYLPVWLASCR